MESNSVMRLGYNTNGFANHRPIDALNLLAEIGYRSVALTIDHHLLDPRTSDWKTQAKEIRQCLDQHALHVVVETGARYLLDAKRKHQPTLLSPDSRERECRAEFLRYSMQVVRELGGDCISIWSGTSGTDESDEVILERLAGELRSLLQVAKELDVVIGFEPEPGMFIDSMAAYDRLLQWIDDPRLQLTLDVGHLFCQGEVPMVDYIRRYADRICNIHIEDMCAGVHEHLMFGEGEIYFPPVIQGLADIGYTGGVHVELSRHSHIAPQAAAKAFAFLDPLVREAETKSAR